MLYTTIKKRKKLYGRSEQIETAIIQGLADDKCLKEIASELGMTISAVTHRCARRRVDLGIRTQHGLVSYYLRNELIK